MNEILSDLDGWQTLCEWLDAKPRKCAYQDDIRLRFGPNIARLIYKGGNTLGRTAHLRRVEVNLVFYYPGWGLRLRKGWRERLTLLRKRSAGALSDPHGIEIGEAESIVDPHGIEVDG